MITDLCGPSFTTSNLQNKNALKQFNRKALPAAKMLENSNINWLRELVNRTIHVSWVAELHFEKSHQSWSGTFGNRIWKCLTYKPWIMLSSTTVWEDSLRKWALEQPVAKRAMVAMYRVLLSETGSKGMAETVRHLSMLEVRIVHGPYKYFLEELQYLNK